MNYVQNLFQPVVRLYGEDANGEDDKKRSPTIFSPGPLTGSS